ncbi:MAG: uracil-DNA glycosylase [Candidatus Margulisiibacteriota bacterium]
MTDNAYNKLVEQCKNCAKCELAKTRTNVVVGVGPVPCDLMLVGEAPGEQEDLQGEPFVGKAGKLLDQILASVGFDRKENIYIANTIKCRPPGNRNPNPDEMNACHPWLEEQIKLVKPKIILFCGSVAMKIAFPDNKEGITKQRGKWLQWQGYDAMVVFHPSYLLRNQSRAVNSPKWHTWQDFKEIRNAWVFYQKVGPSVP